jgi:hypothetical protein
MSCEKNLVRPKKERLNQLVMHSNNKKGNFTTSGSYENTYFTPAFTTNCKFISTFDIMQASMSEDSYKVIMIRNTINSIDFIIDFNHGIYIQNWNEDMAHF